MQLISKRSLAAALVGFGGIALMPMAQAAPQSVDLLNTNGSSSVDITFTNGSGGNNTINGVDAGEYNISLGGGEPQSAFCTDLWDEMSTGETWQANSYQTSAANGLASAAAFYPVAPQNINAIDYIGENYSSASAPQQAAAQLAIWDLVVGGGVTFTAPNTYAWSSDFSETGVKASSVYAIEQSALAANGPQGSQWLEVVDGSQSSGGRPQDLVIGGSPGPNGVTPAPEPSTLAPFLFGILGLGVLMLKARKKSTTPRQTGGLA